jgi:hypothetical protein
MLWNFSPNLSNVAILRSDLDLVVKVVFTNTMRQLPRNADFVTNNYFLGVLAGLSLGEGPGPCQICSWRVSTTSS